MQVKRKPIYRFISETIQDMVIVTMEDEYRNSYAICRIVSFSNDFEWPVTFQGNDIIQP